MIPESSLVPDGLFLTTSREHGVKKNNLSNNLLLSRSPGESGISGASPDTPGAGGWRCPAGREPSGRTGVAMLQRTLWPSSVPALPGPTLLGVQRAGRMQQWGSEGQPLEPGVSAPSRPSPAPRASGRDPALPRRLCALVSSQKPPQQRCGLFQKETPAGETQPWR